MFVTNSREQQCVLLFLKASNTAQQFPSQAEHSTSNSSTKKSAYILATTDRLRVCFTGKQAAALGVWTDLSPKGTEFAPQQTGFHPNMLPVCLRGQPELSKFTAPRQLCYADLVKTNPSNAPGCAAASAELQSFLPPTNREDLCFQAPALRSTACESRAAQGDLRQQLLFSSPPRTLSQTTSFS